MRIKPNGQGERPDYKIGSNKGYSPLCKRAVNNAKLVLGDVRLLFVSNIYSFAMPRTISATCQHLTTAKQTAQQSFAGVELELLNKDTFEFGPFSDILAAQRKKHGKRKAEGSVERI